MIPEIDQVIIEKVSPMIDDGRYPIKRIINDVIVVEADIFSHGHEVVRAVLQYRKKGETEWMESEMTLFDNHRWRSSFQVTENRIYEYTVMGWRDLFLSWLHDTIKKYEAGRDITSELLEGEKFVNDVIQRLTLEDDQKKLFTKSQIKIREQDKKRLNELLFYFKKIPTALDSGAEKLKKKAVKAVKPADSIDPLKQHVFGEELKWIMSRYSERVQAGKFNKILNVAVNRMQAEYASWYEMWPRSQGTIEGKSATFDDMINRLPEIKGLGFDVVYLAPIHPVGKTHRKGPNNSLECPPGSPGCPYAIGNTEECHKEMGKDAGGHMDIEPGLGTIKDFDRFEKECRKLDMEIALDLALQVSPDHPWVERHPEWFNKQPDGTIKYAENPPKKYEDIYPLNFDTSDKEGLWNEVYRIIKYWISHNVKIFRVDNPHTKPVLFWEWLIKKVHTDYPDVIFLSEAFTHPKMMKCLAKAGFTQSYTYFTWRNFKQELVEYHTELTQTDVAEYMRGNLFTNTPDILPHFLQNAPRSAFKIRATLAATLSSTWGMYNGFELCEGKPIPGREEYTDSEKYQYKVWDWDRPGNIKEYITRLNKIRREQPAMQKYRNLHFYKADNDKILFYGKHTDDLSNIIFVIINLDPFKAYESNVYVPTTWFGIADDETYQVLDLITERKYYWKGSLNYIRLDPSEEPAHIFKVEKLSIREQHYDYYEG